MNLIVTLLTAGVTFGTVLMYGTLGEILTEKSGNLNLGVEGIMYMGGAFGLAGAFYYEKAAGLEASGALAIIIAILSAFAAKKVPVMSELDLGSSFCKGKILAVSGTNGKTTTCSLLGKIFERAGKEVFVCGNIGLPISSITKKTSKKSIIVCEVSNFQLETSKTFSPFILPSP